MEGTRLYSTKEVTKILVVSLSRVKQAIKKKQLLYSEIVPGGGRSKIKYKFSKNDIDAYAEKIGLTPRYEVVDEPYQTALYSPAEEDVTSLKILSECAVYVKPQKYVSSGFYFVRFGNKYLADIDYDELTYACHMHTLHLTDDKRYAAVYSEQKVDGIRKEIQELGFGELVEMFIKEDE